MRGVYSFRPLLFPRTAQKTCLPFTLKLLILFPFPSPPPPISPSPLHRKRRLQLFVLNYFQESHRRVDAYISLSFPSFYFLSLLILPYLPFPPPAHRERRLQFTSFTLSKDHTEEESPTFPYRFPRSISFPFLPSPYFTPSSSSSP